jgi:phosphoglycolate phosphatase
MHLVRNVVFDLDGTLVNSLPGIRWSVEAAFAEAGMPAPDRDLKPLIGPPIRQILAEVSGAFGGALDRLERAFRASYDSAGWRRTVCQKGAAAMLRELSSRGLSLWVVTNKPAAATGRILQRLALAGFFVETVCRDSRLPAFQSKAEMLMDLLDRRCLRRTETIMVGDMLDDAGAAAAAGIDCALVPHGYGRGLDSPLPANCEMIRGWSELLKWCAARSETSFAAPMRLGELLI